MGILLAPAIALAFASALAPQPLADLYVDASASNCAGANGTSAAPYCDISAALAVAVDGDTIHIAAGTYFEMLDIGIDVNLIGTDGAAVTTIDANAGGTVVTTQIGTQVTLEGLSITGGNGVWAGGIYGLGDALTLRNMTVSNNTAAGSFCAGAVFSISAETTLTDSVFMDNQCYGTSSSASAVFSNFGTTTLERCTIANNSDTSAWSAALFVWTGNLELRNSTISGNQSRGAYFYETSFVGGIESSVLVDSSTIVDNITTGTGAGFKAYYGPIQVRNSIIAGNGTAAAPADVDGEFVSLGHNLIGTGGPGFGATDLLGSFANPLDPELAPLADNGGGQPTRLPILGSPVRDAGDPLIFEPFDQRGVPRPLGYADIGATEASLGVMIPGCVPVPNSTGRVGGLALTASLIVADNELHLSMLSLPPAVFGYFLTSLSPGNVQQPPGSQGVLCLGGSIGRFVASGQVQASDSVGTISVNFDLTQFPPATGFSSVLAGQVWNFQGWHRDVVGGLPTSNFTQGASLTFQ